MSWQHVKQHAFIPNCAESIKAAVSPLSLEKHAQCRCESNYLLYTQMRPYIYIYIYIYNMYLAHGEESEKSLYCACKQSPCPLIPTRVLPSLRNQAISKKTAEVPRGALSHQSAASSFDGPCRLCVSIILPHNILRHSSLEENNFSPPYIHSPGGCPHSSYNPNERDPSAT